MLSIVVLSVDGCSYSTSLSTNGITIILMSIHLDIVIVMTISSIGIVLKGIV